MVHNMACPGILAGCAQARIGVLASLPHKGPAAAVDRHTGQLAPQPSFLLATALPTLGSRCNWNQALEARSSGCLMGRGFRGDGTSGARTSTSEALTLKWLLSHSELHLNKKK